MPDGDGAVPRGEKGAPAPEVVAVGAPQAMGSVLIAGRFSQRLPAARMQLMPFGVVLTTVQVSFCCEKYTWSRLPFDCSPKATGASSYFLLSCLAISVALWQGIRGLVGAMGGLGEPWSIGAGLLAGTVALTSHGAKASTRAAANSSPEPFSNWILSFAEDAVAVGLTWLATTHPVLTGVIVAVLLVVAVLVLRAFYRALTALRDRLRAAFAPAPPLPPGG